MIDDEKFGAAIIAVIAVALAIVAFLLVVAIIERFGLVGVTAVGSYFIAATVVYRAITARWEAQDD